MVSDELRGFEAAAAHFLKKGRSGGGKRDPNGAMNVAHIILCAADRPMGGSEIVVHALGLGLWASHSKTPANNLIRVLDVESKNDTAIVVKSAPGLFVVKGGSPDPLPILNRHLVEEKHAKRYAQMIADGDIPELAI